jgi:hypothetical protein
MAGRQPNLNAARNGNHRRRLLFANEQIRDSSIAPVAVKHLPELSHFTDSCTRAAVSVVLGRT